MRERLATLLGFRKRPGMAAGVSEQTALEEIVEQGPVLHITTAAGCGLDAKWINTCVLDVQDHLLAEAPSSPFHLPYGDKQFGTVVYAGRLDPDETSRTVAEISRVGHELVLSIEISEDKTLLPGETGTVPAWFYAAIEGLFIADRRVIVTKLGGMSEMFRLRAPHWSDVMRQFDWHPDGHQAIERLTEKWCDRFAIDRVDLSRGSVSAEYWTSERIADLIDAMAAVPRVDTTPNRMKTGKPPRIDSGPLTVFRSQGRTALIDGRRRANRWVCKPGRYPVLLIEV